MAVLTKRLDLHLSLLPFDRLGILSSHDTVEVCWAGDPTRRHAMAGRRQEALPCSSSHVPGSRGVTACLQGHQAELLLACKQPSKRAQRVAQPNNLLVQCGMHRWACKGRVQET